MKIILKIKTLPVDGKLYLEKVFARLRDRGIEYHKVTKHRKDKMIKIRRGIGRYLRA